MSKFAIEYEIMLWYTKTINIDIFISDKVARTALSVRQRTLYQYC